ncbi:MAG TPA: KEOPS complex subunit Pcc1 [Candidatus Bathyarchaeia archaeon]|nr:KEOPS complex subunit Pcc1 [Candidatus Bathyarchaeia archaeon]
MKATVRLPFKSEKQLIALVSALTPEIERQIAARSKVTMMTDSQLLVLNVEAEDTVALRATLNAYLRWINSALNVLETVEKVL